MAGTSPRRRKAPAKRTTVVDDALGTVGSLAPVPKVAAAGAVGTPLAILIVWIAGLLDVDMPPEVGAAIGALIAAAVGWLKSSRGYLSP